MPPDGRHVFFKGKVQMITYLQMKYEAIKRKAGRRKCGQVDHNLGKKSIELIGEECGDSPKQVQLHRFFSVTYTAEQMRWEILEMLKLNMKKYWDA